MDQKIRFENTFRTIFLYPHALSFIVTGLGLAMDTDTPAYGVQKVVRDLGFETFNFPILTDGRFTIYAIVIAGLWQGTGLVMALMLAGLRNIDDEIWKAARVDGIPGVENLSFHHHSDDAAGLHHHARHHFGDYRQGL